MNFTDEQKEVYKKKYGDVFEFTAADGKSCLLRSPDLDTIDASTAIGGGDEMRTRKAIVENCWLDGDPEFKTVVKYQLGLYRFVEDIFVVVGGRLEKL